MINSIANEFGIENKEVYKLVWSLVKLTTEVKLTENELKNISKQLEIVLKGNKSVQEFQSDLIKKYNVSNLNVDYGTVDEAVKTESEKFGKPIENYEQNEYGCFEEKSN
jgi:uncharacterized protein YpuA (DUF1002 family)